MINKVLAVNSKNLTTRRTSHNLKFQRDVSFTSVKSNTGSGPRNDHFKTKFSKDLVTSFYARSFVPSSCCTEVAFPFFGFLEIL